MIQVEINNQRLGGFIEAEVYRSVSNASGEFSITVSAEEGNPIPLKKGAFVRIYIDSHPVLTGYIDNVQGSYSESSHSISFSGRDVTADFIDSSIGDVSNIKPTPTITLKSILRLVLDGMGLSGIGVIQNTDIESFDETVNISAEVTQTGFEFIEPFTRARQVLLVTDGLANLVLTRAGSEIAPAALINKYDNPDNNILSSNFAYDDSQRFNSYVFKSQDAFGADESDNDPSNGVNNSGVANDSEIRSTRRLTLESEENSDSKVCAQRAAWESNLRRAQAKRNSVTVKGFGVNGELWEPNQLVQVVDNFADIESEMLIESVYYKEDLSKGLTSTISLVPPDSYEIEAERDATLTRLSILGDLFDE